MFTNYLFSYTWLPAICWEPVIYDSKREYYGASARRSVTCSRGWVFPISGAACQDFFDTLQMILLSRALPIWFMRLILMSSFMK